MPIYPEYHTELFPDSILKTESPADYEENEPHRNAIREVYISRSIERNLGRRDVVVFYRTGGYYKSVVTTIGIVEEVISGITNETDFIRQCRRRSVFTDGELASQWRAKPSYRPFIVNFLYAYSLPKRINLERLIGLGVIADFKSAPRGFTRLRRKDLEEYPKGEPSRCTYCCRLGRSLPRRYWLERRSTSTDARYSAATLDRR